MPRLLGVFAAGRIVDETLARSQFIGGMTMGIGMALMEETVVDEGSGDFLNHDLAQYDIAACADVQDVGEPPQRRALSFPCCSASSCRVNTLAGLPVRRDLGGKGT